MRPTLSQMPSRRRELAKIRPRPSPSRDNQFSVVLTQDIGGRITVAFDMVASSSYLAPIFDATTFTTRVYRFEGYAKSDVVASYRLAPLRVFAKVENLFDQAIFESGFKTPGRYALAGVAFEF